jgi:hypothetical protein
VPRRYWYSRIAALTGPRLGVLVPGDSAAAGKPALIGAAQMHGVGWPGASQPPAPSDPGVTVSRHRALLIGPSTCGPRASG